MKKKLIAFGICLTFLIQGCSNGGKIIYFDNMIEDDYGAKYFIVTIDSCEYIRGFSVDFSSHKGNCKFCKIRSNKK